MSARRVAAKLAAEKGYAVDRMPIDGKRRLVVFDALTGKVYASADAWDGIANYLTIAAPLGSIADRMSKSVAELRTEAERRR